MVQWGPEASAEDGYEGVGVGWQGDPAYVYAGSLTYHAAFRWTGVDVPQGATIDDPTEIVFTDVAEIGDDKAGLDVFGNDVDDAPALGAGNLPSTWSLTTALTAMPLQDIGTVTIDVADQVQEIVNRASWVAENAMAFVVFEDGSSGAGNYYSFDGGAGNEATLEINYTLAGESLTDAGESDDVIVGTVVLQFESPSEATEGADSVEGSIGVLTDALAEASEGADSISGTIELHQGPISEASQADDVIVGNLVGADFEDAITEEGESSDAFTRTSLYYPGTPENTQADDVIVGALTFFPEALSEGGAAGDTVVSVLADVAQEISEATEAADTTTATIVAYVESLSDGSIGTDDTDYELGAGGSGSLLSDSALSGNLIVNENNAVGVQAFYSGNNEGLGFSWTSPAEPTRIVGVAFGLNKDQNPIGNLVSRVYAATGTVGTNARPTGSALFSSVTLNDMSLLPTSSFQWVGFVYNWLPAASTDYVFTLELESTSTTNISNRPRIRGVLTDEVAGSNKSTSDDLATWTAQSGQDLDIRIFALSLPDTIGLVGLTHMTSLN